MKARVGIAARLIKEAAVGWFDDNVSIHGAALAFYTVFSVAPLLVISIAIVGLVFGSQASRGDIFSAIQDLVGPDGARSIEGLVRSAASQRHLGKIATIIGAVTLVIGASGVFNQLQQSLNIIWRVQTRPGQGLWVFLRRRLLTFSMVIAVGFILLVSLVVSAVISGLGHLVGGTLPGGEALWHLLHFVISFGVTTVLFAAILKILPDVKLDWHDVWLGSAATSLLFTLGKLLIGLYLGHSGISSSYGAMGSFVIVLIWVFYASQILLFGAELTRAFSALDGKVVSAKTGSRLLPQQQTPYRAAS